MPRGVLRVATGARLRAQLQECTDPRQTRPWLRRVRLPRSRIQWRLMTLAELTVTHLRCIEHAQLEIPPGLALICGGNGSGKTSLLEGIFLLGRGRSFRTRNSERLIQRGQDHLRVIGCIMSPSGQAQALGFEFTRDGTSARIGGRPAQSLAELSHAFPVQVIEPGVHKLVEEGGYRRRRWMDWAVFHVEPHFVDTWVRYTRALKQRNAALRRRSEATVWDPELARLGEVIAESRGRFLTELQPTGSRPWQR